MPKLINEKSRWFMMLILLLASSFVSMASAESLKSLANGKPRHGLPEETYVSVETRRLKNARVLWVNFEALRRMGVEVPAEGLTAAFEQQLLEEFAYIVPDKNQRIFTDHTKKFYADRYGGGGMNGNLGSGRAAIAGAFQIKGIGVTPMVGPKVEDRAHATGGVGYREGMLESVWSVLLNHELPHGANEVIVLIDTGLNTPAVGDLNIQPRLLVVRQDPLRPAHFMRNQYVEGQEAMMDKVRVEKALQLLPLKLPLPQNNHAQSAQNSPKEGWDEFVARVADQYAFSYVHRLHHGATTPSNIEIDAKGLDFCTQTALEGYQKILGWDFGYFGDPAVMENELLFRIADDFEQTFPVDWRSIAPNREEISKNLRERFDERVRKEFLLLTGAPEEGVEPMINSEAAIELGNVMKLIANHGNTKISEGKIVLPKNQGTFDLGAILRKSALSVFRPEELKQAVAPLLKDAVLRHRFIQEYSRFMNELKSVLQKQGFSAESISHYIVEASKMRTKSRPSLYRGLPLVAKLTGVMARFRWTRNNQETQNTIDEMIYEHRISFKDIDPYTVVTKETARPTQGIFERTVFDMKTDRFYRAYRVQSSNQEWNILGAKIKRQEKEKPLLRYRLNKDSTDQFAQPIIVADFLEFRIPLESPAQEISLLGLAPWRASMAAPTPINGGGHQCLRALGVF